MMALKYSTAKESGEHLKDVTYTGYIPSRAAIAAAASRILAA
jgi:hypothetical protein